MEQANWPPHILKVTSPHGQCHRSGRFVLVDGERRNGYPVWKHSSNDNLLYAMWMGKWGIASRKECDAANSNLAYIHSSACHEELMPHRVRGLWKYWSGTSWVADRSITVSGVKVEGPQLTLEQGLELEDRLIQQYCTEEFQRKLHEAWNSAGGNVVKQREARALICLPIQIAAIKKYGFEPSIKGVRQSVLAFTALSTEPGIQYRGRIFDWLLNPDKQQQAPMPPIHSIKKEETGHSGRMISISFFYVSGEKLTTLSWSPRKTVASLQEAVEKTIVDSTQQCMAGPFKLVYQNLTLEDAQALADVPISEGAKVTVVFLRHNRVLTASSDWTAKFFDVTSGACLQTFEGHSASVRRAAVSHDGRSVATASADGTAMLFDSSTGSCKQVFCAHRKAVNSVVFSPDDISLLTASDDGTIKLHRVDSGRCELSFPNAGERVLTAVMSPDASLILISSGDCFAKVLEAQTGRHQQILRGHKASVNSAEFSPDGRKAVTASGDHSAKVFNLQTGLCFSILLGHSKSVNSAIFSSDSQQVLSASDDCTVRLFDVQTGGCIQLFRIHDQCITAAIFCPDGRHILASSDDNRARLFRISTGKCDNSYVGHISTVNHLFMEP